MRARYCLTALGAAALSLTLAGCDPFIGSSYQLFEQTSGVKLPIVSDNPTMICLSSAYGTKDEPGRLVLRFAALGAKDGPYQYIVLKYDGKAFVPADASFHPVPGQDGLYIGTVEDPTANVQDSFIATADRTSLTVYAVLPQTLQAIAAAHNVSFDGDKFTAGSAEDQRAMVLEAAHTNLAKAVTILDCKVDALEQSDQPTPSVDDTSPPDTPNDSNGN